MNVRRLIVIGCAIAAIVTVLYPPSRPLPKSYSEMLTAYCTIDESIAECTEQVGDAWANLRR